MKSKLVIYLIAPQPNFLKKYYKMATLYVTSAPTNAKCILSGDSIDPETKYTPCTFTALEIGAEHTVTCSKPGYITESITTTINSSAEGIGFGLDEEEEIEKHRIRFFSNPTYAWIKVYWEDTGLLYGQGQTRPIDWTQATFYLEDGRGYIVEIGKRCYKTGTIHIVPWKDKDWSFQLIKDATQGTSSTQSPTTNRTTAGTKGTAGTY